MVAAALRRRNAYRLNGAWILLIVLLALVAACGLAEIPETGLILGWLGRNVIVTVLLATCLFVLSATRRREAALLLDGRIARPEPRAAGGAQSDVG